MATHQDFFIAIAIATAQMIKFGKLNHRGTWQGTDVSKKPEMTAYELLHYPMRVPMRSEDVGYYRTAINPNIPWADDHFAERIGGQPLNPGIEWKNWPWGKNAEKFLMPNGQFDHNYMERYWPKWAGVTDGGIITIEHPEELCAPHKGIRFDYGDLSDVIEELAHEPTSRQAILPIFFPEDTGYRPGRRKPCSISYHFMLNNTGGLDIFYHLRSCDLIRHFRDDIYMTVRLLLHVLDQLRYLDPFWNTIKPGDYVMQIGNLHVFANDMINLKATR